jgi:hypothetical protein
MTRGNEPDEGSTGSKSPGGDAAARVESLNAHRPAEGRRATPARRQIPAEDLEPIVRRAAEIQNKRGNPGSQMLTEEEVVEIGRQVGLEPAYVRRAMAEVRAESLAPGHPPGNRILDLLAGDARVEVRRVVAGEPTLIQKQVEIQLRDREKLTALRHQPLRSVWEASAGVMDRLERFMNFSGKEYALAEARQVHFAVAEIEPGWSLATLAADFGNKREELLYTVGGVVAVVAVFAAVFTGDSVSSVILTAGAALLAALASAAVGVPWLRWTMKKRCDRIELILEGLLDRADR